MAGGRISLLLCTALALFYRAQCEYEWSGFVNALQQPVNFTCPDNLAISGIASDFSTSVFDRRWEFQCSSGGGLANVSSTCTLQSDVHVVAADIDYSCPGEAYFAGLASEFDSSSIDRVWSVYCCERPFSVLINCEILTTSWDNILRENLNYSAPDGYVIAGFESFFFNRDRRWRFRACQIEVNCGDPGTPDNAVRQGSSFLYQDEVVFTCDNGYYQSSGPDGGVRTCLDTGLWSGTQPQCSLCTDIANCADIRCSNSSGQQCFECESDNGVGQQAFSNLLTECQPLCSWLGSFCYPGVCPGTPDSCNCTQGFAGENCLEITDTPDFLSCSVTLRGPQGQMFQEDCRSNSSYSSSNFTNFVPNGLVGAWSSLYLVPLSLPPKPAYVSAFRVGVTVSETRATVFRAANPTLPVSETTHACNSSSVFSSDSPSSGVVMCSTLATPTDLITHTFLHGDTVTLEVYAYTGGHLDVRNLDTAAVIRQYYSGSPVIGVTTLVLDLLAPTHCSLAGPPFCLPAQSILDLGTEITAENVTTVRWGGWEDEPSGVVLYTLKVFMLAVVGDSLMEGSQILNESVYHTDQTTYDVTVSLPSEGPYSFVLLTTDQATNAQTSRRLVFYDATSNLTLAPDAPLRVVSAVPETGLLWQNFTDGPLVINGRGHFYNTHLRTQNYLSPVANYSGGVEPEYDHPLDLGRYPRRGTPNALGVTRLLYEVRVDHDGGLSQASVTQPELFGFETENLAIDDLELNVSAVDGDSIRVWFQAEDFNGLKEVDSVLVHVDSSSPVLRDLWLEYGGETGLFLHGTESLLDLNIQFQTYDEHSGILMVEWSIGTEPGANNVGYGNLPVQTENVTSVCPAPDCYCDPLAHCSRAFYAFSPPDSGFPTSSLARHDTDYFITISVTNYALLTSSLTRQFTVDITAPLTGVVFDAPSGVVDADFQTSLSLTAWWSGFFDRETDIAFYQYTIDTVCANETIFSYPLGPESQAVETRASSVVWIAPEEGTYYASVVAYNNAFRPSSVVCSDGITIDTQVPYFEGVTIPGAVISSGLARGEDGDVWLIGSNRERRSVERIEECFNRSSLISARELSKYPVSSTQMTLDPTVCIQQQPFSPSVAYLPADRVLNVSWSAGDNHAIRRHRVCVTNSTGDTLQGPFAPYYPTAAQTHYSIYDPAIISNGNRFYVSIILEDLAGLETQLDIGPLMIDVTPPQVNGSIAVERFGDYVALVWDTDTFTDPEVVSDSLSYEYAVGRSPFDTKLPVKTYQRCLLATPCSGCPVPNGICLNASSLQLISGQQYHFTVRVRNSVGLSSAITSDPYLHVSGPPSPGVVLDIDPSARFGIEGNGLSLHDKDVDFLVDTTDLVATWQGFEHAHLPVTFWVGLGAEPQSDNIASFVYVGQNTSYTFNNLTFDEEFKMCYVTVIATNEYGDTTSSSDGVLILLNVMPLISSGKVYDGGEEMDIDYQYSTSFAAARWQFPSMLTPFLSHYNWAIYQEDDSNLTALPDSAALVKSFDNVGADQLSSTGGLNLDVGKRYVSAVQACHFSSCFSPIFSDGFLVTSSPPSTSNVTATFAPFQFDSEYGTSTVGLLTISWSPFPYSQISYCEWGLGTGAPAHELLQYWNEVEGSLSYISVTVNLTISVHTTNTVTLRCYNAAGLRSSTDAYAPLQWIIDGEIVPQDSVPRSNLIIFDLPDSQVPPLTTTDWRELEYREWVPTDIQYSASLSSLSAAWPDLRYMEYEYSVSALQQFQTCPSSDAMGCGTTIANALTISDLSLVDGERYYVCVRAVRQNAIHPTPSTPQVLMVCSNGVTVDYSPPRGGCVQIAPPLLLREVTIELDDDDEMESGDAPLIESRLRRQCGNGSRFQSSSSDLHIVWNQFSDVEEYGNPVHSSGVAYYEYAVGTSSGGTDVVDFTSVGVSTEVIVRGLILYQQHTYYATIRAYDLAGQWSEVISPGVTVDVTPPTIGNLWIEGGSQYNTQGLTVNWTPIRDRESGVSSFECGLGSRPGYSDIKPWTVGSEAMLTGASLPPEFVSAQVTDGQLAFLTIKATNGAGLTASVSSAGYLMDSSQPGTGTVYDGEREMPELDYSSSMSSVSAWWRGFSDPHSGISEYRWAIGSSAGCTDVQGFQTVGTATAACRSGLQLLHGRRYYVTVQACNPLGLCSSAGSNGVTIDTTPPIPGKLSHGYSAMENNAQFQASRSYLSANWNRFHDAESSLRNYVYSAGLSPHDDSILPATLLPPDTSSLLLPTPFPLTSGNLVYFTLTAYNRAGMSTVVTSSGVFIDDSPPEVEGQVTIDTAWAGSVSMETQFATSALRAVWNFTDSQSPMVRHYSTLVHRSGTSQPLSAQTSGSEAAVAVALPSPSDGEAYTVLAIGCNAAGLCAESESTGVLFDSSPPIDGYFAVETDSTYQPYRTVPGGMTWRNRIFRSPPHAEFNLAFVGFSDPHSGISAYWATVGSNYTLSDLTQGPARLQPVVASVNGTLIAALPLTQLVTLTDVVYVSLWAVNGVGLRSHTVQAQFRIDDNTNVDNNGSLTLLRSSSCASESCLGHCTCAARGDLCETTPISPCQNLSSGSLPDDMQVLVSIAVPQLQPGADRTTLYTAVSDKLTGTWETATPGSSRVQWVDWTVGVAGLRPGEGLMDIVNDPVWRVAGFDDATATFTPSAAYPLQHGTTYVFYVRAWYDETQYAVFVSSGVTVDRQGPQVERGWRVREVGDTDRQIDADYIRSDSTVQVSWLGVFTGSLSGGLSSYVIGLGDAPGSDNYYPFANVSTALRIINITDLSLSDGRKYFTTIRAISPLGVTKDSTSDGFTVSLLPPNPGTVLDGSRYYDVIAQTSTTVYSVRWIGFNDLQSGIHHYEVALAESASSPPQESDFVNTGIGLQATLSGQTLLHGRTYLAYVVAVNVVGSRSNAVASTGVIVDDSRPVGVQCTAYGPDLLSNPSFEGVSSTPSVCPGVVALGSATEEWNLEALYARVEHATAEFSPYDGCVSVYLVGAISQTFNTTPSTVYRLSLALARHSSDRSEHTSLLRAKLIAPGLERIISLRALDEGQTSSEWRRYDFTFTADSTSTKVSIETVSNNYGILLDRFSIRSCTSATELSSTDTIVQWPSVFHLGQDSIAYTRTRINANWDITDPESGIREYYWAIGTIPGGEQLQRYTSIGGASYGTSAELNLSACANVFVSVVAWNYAGLERVVYSGAFAVDQTPPVLNGSIDDGAYQNSTIVTADWSEFVDPESGITECRWAVGTALGLADVNGYQISTATSGSSSDLSPISHGTMLYSSVVCLNGAGMYSTAYSDGVTVLTQPPSHSEAFAYISSHLLTATYAAENGYLPTDDVLFTWGGFEDNSSSPLFYEVRITEAGSGTRGPWNDVRYAQTLSLRVANLTQDVAHTIEVRAVNFALQASQSIAREFTIVTNPPAYTGVPINATWSSNNTLEIEWTGRFSSPAPLYYEFSLGTQLGSGSIRQWVSTNSTVVLVADSRLRQHEDYFISLIAITGAGLHTTVSRMIAGMPV